MENPELNRSPENSPETKEEIQAEIRRKIEHALRGVDQSKPFDPEQVIYGDEKINIEDSVPSKQESKDVPSFTPQEKLGFDSEKRVEMPAIKPSDLMQDAIHGEKQVLPKDYRPPKNQPEDTDVGFDD